MTAADKQDVVDRLFAERCSCVIRYGDEVRSFHERGVRDLYRLLRDDPAFLRGAFVADKVVGKGAAALMILGGVEALFAEVVSRPALELLDGAGVHAEWGAVVPHVINRAGTGICPVERLCAPCATAAECLPRIEAFLQRSDAIEPSNPIEHE